MARFLGYDGNVQTRASVIVLHFMLAVQRQADRFLNTTLPLEGVTTARWLLG
jgi:hypothetical protein